MLKAGAVNRRPPVEFSPSRRAFDNGRSFTVAGPARFARFSGMRFLSVMFFAGGLCCLALSAGRAADGEPYDWQLEDRADDYLAEAEDAENQSDLDRAIRYYAQASSIYKYLHGSTTDDDDEEYFLETLMDVYWRIGRARLERDGFEAAKSSFKRMLALHEARVLEDPGSTTYAFSAAQAFDRLATVAGNARAAEDAIRWRNRAAELQGGEITPADPGQRWARFGSFDGIAQAKYDEGDFAAAEENLEMARELGEGLLEDDPKNLVWLDGVADVYVRLGNTVWRQERYEDALDYFREALRLNLRLRYASGAGDRSRVVGKEIHNRNLIGETLFQLGRHREAVDQFAGAIRLRPELDPDAADRGWRESEVALSHYLAGKSQAASGWNGIRSSIRSFEASVQLLEDLEQAGILPSERKSWIAEHRETLDEARRILDAWDQNNQKDPDTAIRLADAVISGGALELSSEIWNEAIAQLEKISEGDGNAYPQSRILLAITLADEDVIRSNQLLDEAIASFGGSEANGAGDAAEWLYRAHLQATYNRAGVSPREAKRHGEKALAQADEAGLGPERQAPIHGLLTGICASLREFDEAYEHQMRHTELLVDQYGAAPDAGEARDALVSSYGNLAWYALFARNFPSAIDSAQSGLDLEYERWIAGNLAHALLLSDRYEEAMKIYRRHQGKPLGDGTTRLFEEVTKIDFDELSAAGVMHPDMERVEIELGVAEG